MARAPLGARVWFIGARGGVATTSIIGLIALKNGWTETAGLVSELEIFKELELVQWDELVLGGHEIRQVDLIDQALILSNDSRAIDRDLVVRCGEELQTIDKRIKPGVPMFDGLYEKCLAYSVLPGVALGYHTCAAWAKLTPQKNWYRSWETGQQAIREGTRIIQCVGFDAGPRDSVRYADREGYDDPMFEMRYPLREWKMDREACEQVIRNAGLDVPPKSSCTGCIATQPFELESFPTSEHARLVLLEARAAPRLRNCDGLWRKPIKGRNGATPRPGSMTEHIVTTGSLSQEVVTQIQQQAVPMLDRWCSGIGDEPVEHRPCIGEWLEMFDAAHSQMDQGGRYVRYQDQMSIPAKAA